jgi:hypothetical protein
MIQHVINSKHICEIAAKNSQQQIEGGFILASSKYA